MSSPKANPKTSNLSRLAFLVLSMTLVVPLVSSSLTTARAQKDDEDSLYKYLTVFTEVLRLVRSTYVTETDLRGLMAGALDGATDALDSFSVFVPEEQVDGYKKTREVGRSHSGMLVLKERGVAFVVAVDEGSPADLAGVEPGDILSEIQDLSSRSMPLWQIKGFLADEVGSKLKLELLRRGTPVDVEFELAEFAPPKPTSEVVSGVTVLRLPAFSDGSEEGLGRLMAEVKTDRLLIDLRGVAGGDIESAYTVARRFATGDLGFLLENGEIKKTFSSKDMVNLEGREIGVLVDRGSQGAAEILTAILREGGAKILGERTFGHAGRLGFNKLASGGYLEMTEGFYTGPDGEPLKEGLEPDLEVRLLRVADSDEDDVDAFLEKAIELFVQGEDEDQQKVA
jgi:carboxyl-terminal processing protease